MTSNRAVKRSRSTTSGVNGGGSDSNSNNEGNVTEATSLTSRSVKVPSRPSRSQTPEPQLEVGQPTTTSLTSSVESGGTAPPHKLSQRALVRMHGWEPVVKLPEGASAVPLSDVPTADVVWLNDSTSVTLIPNDIAGGGVRTRRAAARLAALAPPTSYLVYTRDPLMKVKRAGQKNVHVVAGVPPGGDPRSVLSEVSLVSSLKQTERSAATSAVGSEEKETQGRDESGTEDGNGSDDDMAEDAFEEGSDAEWNTQSKVNESQQAPAGEDKRQFEGAVSESEKGGQSEHGEQHGVIEMAEIDNGEVVPLGREDETQSEAESSRPSAEDGEDTDGEEEEEENNEDGGNENGKDGRSGGATRIRRRRGLVGWLSRRRSRYGCERRRRRKTDSSSAADGQQTRIGVLSAAQAMLPPPYRRNRRLKRKPDVTEDTPIFTLHSQLRDRTPGIFVKAPFSTDDDVLRSTLDWRDNPTLLYARLLWEFAPREFLEQIERRRASSVVAPKTTSIFSQSLGSLPSVKQE